MGPIRYLTLRRMHLVRRALLRAESLETSVTRIATDHGFWELGHFSVAYRALFGETPSASLRQSPGNQRIFRDRPSSPTEPVSRRPGSAAAGFHQHRVAVKPPVASPATRCAK
jgi:AraC-like DNA-binding protein